MESQWRTSHNSTTILLHLDNNSIFRLENCIARTAEGEIYISYILRWLIEVQFAQLHCLTEVQFAQVHCCIFMLPNEHELDT